MKVTVSASNTVIGRAYMRDYELALRERGVGYSVMANCGRIAITYVEKGKENEKNNR
ncbi:MAG: hypothetical protein Q4C03_04240 [bacterium]|nr:hypothetical protein [bacterium]